MKVSAGTRGTSFTSGRQVTFTVTGLANNDYSRTADLVMNVPYTRMNETMRMVQRMGGKITGVSVSGGDLAAAAPAPRKSTSRASSSKAAKAKASEE
jgi:phycocyanin-associated rod protein